MFTGRDVSSGCSVLLLLLLTSHCLVSCASTECVPYPVALKLGNVALDNTTARGVSLSVGDPEQPFAFLPQWPLNNVFVYGTEGYCGETWSDAACKTFRGGHYDPSASTTQEFVDSDSLPNEDQPYPDFRWLTDNLTLNSNLTLGEFPLGIPRADWGAEGYHPQAAFGLGQNSTILSTLHTLGYIASRSWAMFWGRTGPNPNTHVNGSFVFGGFDRAKTTGQNYTNDLNFSRPGCSTGMLVTITDVALDFPNGTSASLFGGIQSKAISACIVPDYPVLMTLPRDPFFETFESFTQTSLPHRTYGINYYSLLYEDPSEAYNGDITITLSSGFSVRIPNDQLVVPNRYIDKPTGEIISNTSTPNLVINAMQEVNADDLPQLGRHFLSSAYLMLNQDANKFTLWEAIPTADENLVAVDSRNLLVDSFCSSQSTDPSSEQTSKGTTPGNGADENQKLSTEEIAGIAVGSVAAAAILTGFAVFFFCTKKSKKPREKRGVSVVDGYYYPQAAHASHRPPYELPPGPFQPYTRNELAPRPLDPYITNELSGTPVPKRHFEVMELP